MMVKLFFFLASVHGIFSLIAEFLDKPSDVNAILCAIYLVGGGIVSKLDNL
jgi:hypothetical protein